MIKAAISLFSALIFCFLFSSCGSGSAEDSSQTDTISGDTVAIEVPIKNYTLPSPLQIAAIFKKSGLIYLEGLTNPEANVSRYSSNLSKSIGLGIYSADLSYCVINKKVQPSITYMKISRQMADHIGIGAIFDSHNIAPRFEKNLNNDDSLTSIIAELQMETDMYLESNEQEHISSIVFSGAWIEGMYLGSKVFEKTKDKVLLERIVEQMTILGSITNVLKSYEEKDPGITVLLAEFNAVKMVYQEFESVKKYMAQAEEDETSVVLSEQEGLILGKKITEIRTKLVKG